MPEPTYEQRMSQMEKLLETSIKIIRRHDEEIGDLREMTQRNAEAIEDLREMTRRNAEAIQEQARQNAESMARLTHQMGELTVMFQESMGIIRQIQLEVRGLQQENRRILERVFGPEEDD